jgi:predicted GH43/DUF377 family glycosyl hydrolase
MTRKVLIAGIMFIVIPFTIPGQDNRSLQKPEMMFGDTSRTGSPFSKDPHVISFGGRYLMYYSIQPYKDKTNPVQGWGIGIAESIDRTNWKKIGEITPAADYESKGLCAPCAKVIAGKVHLFYQTYGNGKNDAICHASSSDGVHFERNKTNPVFRPTGDWNCGRAIDAEVFAFKGKYFLLFATRDPEYKIQIQGVASAPINTNFGRDQWTQLTNEPILKPEYPWEGQCVEGASVIQVGDLLYMFYAGAYNNYPQQIGVAKSSDGVKWERISNKPFLRNGFPGEWNYSESGHPHIFKDNNGRSYLFYQGNNDNGTTWFISNREVKWNEFGPYLTPLRSEKGLVRVRFNETDSLYANPGQGWMSSRFPSTVKYLRMGWADFEPEHGKYDWTKIDNAIASARQKGSKIAIRIMTCSPHSSGYYTSPKWLFDEGCKSYEYLVGGDDPTSGGTRITRIEPDYSDPLYLLRHAEFIKALGGRYDNSSDIDFLDIGSYGYWGEWHTPHPAPVEVRRKIVDMYISAFKNTPLVFMSDDAEVLGYALEKGAGLRRDGIGSRWHEQNWIGTGKYTKVKGMEDAWKHSPVVFEWYGNYEYLVGRGWSFDTAVNFMLRNHVTIINDNIGKVPAEKMSQIDKLSRLSGARFVLNEISHQESVRLGSPLKVNMNWTNSGAGKVYKSYILKFFLLSELNEIVFEDSFNTDPSDWMPGEIMIQEEFQIPASLKKGTCKIAIALASTRGDQPPFKLAFDVKPVNGLYILSKVKLR